MGTVRATEGWVTSYVAMAPSATFLKTSAARFSSNASDSLAADRARLIAVLRERGCGSLLRGWRRELDPDGSLDLGFQDFCRSVANLGGELDALRLFGIDGGNETLSLDELAAAEGALVERFREWVKNSFGGPVGMFAALDPSDDGQLSQETFVAGCRAHSFTASNAEFSELWSLLDVDDAGTVAEQDVMFLEIDKQARELEIFRSKMRSAHQRQRLLAYVYWHDSHKITNPTHRRACRPWLAENFEKLPALVSDKRVDWKRLTHRQAVQARSTFMQHLRGTFGNEVRAWRRGLDPEGRFVMNRTSLYRYCRNADLDVDLPALWRGMDRDGDGNFTMEELDPQRALALAGLRSWCHKTFGSCSAIWEHPKLVAARSRPHLHGCWVSAKKLLSGAFSDVLRALGWPGTGSSEADKLLVSALDLYGCGFISQPDLWWLDAWEPPQYLVETPDAGAWAELRGRMLEQYGQPLLAWRALLDTNSKNRVNWGQFVIACKKLKFRGSPGCAWRCLDQDVDGVICLREYDAASAELLGSFKSWADANFGSVELAFRAFDTDGSGSLTYAELRRACQKLKWQGEVRLLFNCLGVGASTGGSLQGGRRGLALADIAFLDFWAEDEPSVESGVEAQAQVAALKAKLRPEPAQPRSPEFAQERRAKQCSACRACSASGGSVGGVSGNEFGLGTAKLVKSTSVPEFERLHRTYHCMATAAPRRRAPARASSGPLPWLEKLQRLEQEASDA